MPSQPIPNSRATDSIKRIKASTILAPRKPAPPALRELSPIISGGEQAVLKVFCQYLMTPGYMLCFSGDDRHTHEGSLDRLVGRGILRAERFAGGYSLTCKGYDVMRGAG